jgi:hypothetical protein
MMIFFLGSQSHDEEIEIRRRPQPGAGSLGKSWRDLIPVIKVDVSSVRN